VRLLGLRPLEELDRDDLVGGDEAPGHGAAALDLDPAAVGGQDWPLPARPTSPSAVVFSGTITECVVPARRVTRMKASATRRS
jgi:hypothetical protein